MMSALVISKKKSNNSCLQICATLLRMSISAIEWSKTKDWITDRHPGVYGIRHQCLSGHNLPSKDDQYRLLLTPVNLWEQTDHFPLRSARPNVSCQPSVMSSDRISAAAWFCRHYMVSQSQGSDMDRDLGPPRGDEWHHGVHFSYDFSP